MSDASPLIVPIVVEALVANDSVRTNGDAFIRVQMQYGNMRYGGNGEPSISTPSDVNFTSSGNMPSSVTGRNDLSASDYYNGVYLKWRLPDALTRGTRENASETTTFPPVPNRWLVVRYGDGDTRQATAWIVESDYSGHETGYPQNASQVGSLYVDDSGGSPPSSVYIGRNVPLTPKGWAEPGYDLGLTAIAPGNPTFAVYQPACNNIFSFMDPLNGSPGQSLSYLVLGWFSNASNDPLAKADQGGDFARILGELGWCLPPGTDGTPTAGWSIFSGFVTGVQWQNDATIPGGSPASSCPISVSVGNTSIEALTALVEAQATGQDDPDVADWVDLLEAFQLDLLRVLDAPDGAAVLAEKIHASEFQKFSGGYLWEIADAPGANAQASADELAIEERWLADLNRAQAAVNDAGRQLSAAEDLLYVMWWKFICFPAATTQDGTNIPKLKNDRAIRRELNPTMRGSLAQRTHQLLTEYHRLARDVPGGDSPQSLQKAIDRFAASKRLPASRVLKRTAAPRFFMPNDPVVLIAGAGASGIVAGSGTLCCRFPSQLITGLDVDGTIVGASSDGLTIPQPDLSGVSGAPWSAKLVAQLVQEFFLLDPDNAPAISASVPGSTAAEIQQAMSDAANYVGTLPVNAGTSAWSQNPWHPLLLYWEATYYPIPYGDPDSPNWSFGEGRYSWDGHMHGTPPASFTLQGRIQLTPAAAFNMQSRIQSFLSSNPSLDPEELNGFESLNNFIQTTDQWDLLSQALNGFNAQLSLRETGVYQSPEDAHPITNPRISTLIGDAAGYPPSLGTIPVDKSAIPHSNFQPLRGGQFLIEQLFVVDEWGQAIEPITMGDYANYTVLCPPHMTPTTPIIGGTADSFVQLPPAFLQPARLAFDPIPCTEDGDNPGVAPSAGPICGWVLLNHLDASLMAYDARGGALGEMAAGITASDVPSVCWVPAPGCPYATLAQVADEVPFFGPFLQGLGQQGPSTFADFLEAIDESSWTIAPSGAAFDSDRTAFVGRPLAMTRSRLQFQLDGPPLSDPSWQYTFDPQVPAVAGYSLPIELGNSDRIEDGLIGYLVEGQYDKFNVVPQAGVAISGGYLKPIGLDGNYIFLPPDGVTSQEVLMLVDPRAPVHAVTGILPTAELALPPPLVSAALAAMDVTFRVDGILTDQQIGAGPAPNTTVLMPLPGGNAGVWTWVENGGDGWMSFPTAPNDTTARLSDVLPVLRRGLLRLAPGQVVSGGADLPSVAATSGRPGPRSSREKRR